MCGVFKLGIRTEIMDLSDALERGYHVGIGLCAMGFTNQILFPLFVSIFENISMNQYGRSLIDQDRLKSIPPLSTGLDALDYLNVAASLIFEQRYQEALCCDFACAAFHNYLALAERNNRNDLQSRVRFAVGLVPPHNIGHMQLEFKDGNGYIPFQPSVHTPEIAIEKVKRYSNRTRKEKTEQWLERTLCRSFPGTRLLYPTLESFAIWGGAVGFIMADYRRKGAFGPND